jgi:hypothetical protein
MKVSIKSFEINMEVKSKGVEFEVRSPDNDFLGDCYLTMTGLIWCNGKIDRDNGEKISWGDFITLMSDSEELKKAIRNAKKHR